MLCDAYSQRVAATRVAHVHAAVRYAGPLHDRLVVYVVIAGLIVTAVAPAEITSSLVAILGGGAGAVAVTCMAASLATGTLLTPLWLSAALSDVHVDRAGLVLELALCVSLPLILCVALRTRFEGLAAHSARALDLSALSV